MRYIGSCTLLAILTKARMFLKVVVHINIEICKENSTRANVTIATIVIKTKFTYKVPSNLNDLTSI